jgi:BirA family biotin operon repressor/biotin-[acetyl-CoA-carboxylase] ligase
VDAATLERHTDKLIAQIRRRPGRYYPWEKLAASLMISGENLRKVVDTALSWGYRLKVRKTRGVAFVAPPDAMIPTEIQYKLRTRWLAHTVYSFQSVKSTNDLAAQYAERGAPEGAIVTAEEQVQGRGRFSRVWFSPPGVGVYLSIILRPALRPEAAPGLSIMTALALADAVAALEPGEVKIKWPNDVLINGRKTAGILTELSAERNRVNHVVIGVGINVNQQPGMFPEDIRPEATSIRRESRHLVDRLELLRSFLVLFEREYQKYLRYRLRKSHARLKKYSSLIDQEITVKSGESQLTGLVKDIDRNGCLVLDTEFGVQTITAGEVTVVRK